MIMDYLQVKSAYQMKVVPQKREITFLSKQTGIAQLWRWNEQWQTSEQVTFLPDRVVEVEHSPCGTKTLVGMDNKGDERQQFFLLKDNGAVVKPLTDAPEYFHYFGGWSSCGEKIAWSSNRRHPRCFDIFVQDVESGVYEEVYRYDGRCDPIGWLPNGTGLIFSVQETNIDNALYLLDLRTKQAEKLLICEKQARFHSLQLTKDGQVGFVVTDRDDNTMALCRFSLSDGAMEKFAHVEKWDIEEVKLSPDESWLAFTINEGGRSTLALYSLADHRWENAEGVPSGVIQSVSWLTEDQLAFTLKSPILPGDVWTYTLSEKSSTRVTSIGRAEAIEETLVDPEMCTFTSFDGLEVPYFLYAKEKTGKNPVVVYVHGGPESQIRAEYHPVFQYLANQGFTVVAPNVRGSMGYGRQYVQLDDRRKRMDSVADLAWLVKDLSKKETVDPEAIGIMGRSYGGFMVLAALTHYPDLWAAGVDIVGISHFRTFLENTGEWRRKLREVEYGYLGEDNDFFEDIAPLNHSDKIKAPLLVFHGRNDTRVPVSEAEQLVADMKYRGQQVDLHIFEDEGHFTEKLDNHITLNQKITQFFLYHLNHSKSEKE
ncbi:peptidase S9 [Brevibacillus choshinensis]|uniref:Peptidase S9 n=1 Tax=Brevibacillus choshinensis TaxID=54911 RepID=A0ABR5NE30_BRECH|nr:S9 family peptidase [Brevibacillus choshinensis]KQL49806.1 peptidase S9 [Brevibacillus choshinensis]